MKSSNPSFALVLTFFILLGITSADPQNTSLVPTHSSPYDTGIPGPTNEPNPTNSAYSLSSITASVSSAMSSASSSASSAASQASSSVSSAISSRSSEVSSSVASISSQVSASLSSASASASSSSPVSSGNVGVVQKPMATAGALLGGVIGVVALF